MSEITQRVKYVVTVDSTELDGFKAKIDAASSSIAGMSFALRTFAVAANQGLLSSLTKLNSRLGNLTKNSAGAATSFGDLGAVMSAQATAMASLATSVNSMAVGFKAAATASKSMKTELKSTTTEAANSGVEAKRTGMTWLRAFGVFQSAKYMIRQTFEAIKEGAQQLDLDRVLGQQFANFNTQIQKAQELTAGTVSKGGLTKSFALMSSFGIPMDKFAENMELVQKMAIRTGQSSEFLTESFSRGISRLSPLILDNLGIQVSLAQANQEYSAATGILTSEMTKQDKTAALLEHTLAKLRDRTKGVSLEAGSASAAVARFETALDDAWMGVKKWGGGVLGIFQGQKADVLDLANTYEGAIASISRLQEAGLLGSLPTTLDKAKNAFEVLSRIAPNVVEPIDQFHGSMEDVNNALEIANMLLIDMRENGRDGSSAVGDAMGIVGETRAEWVTFAQTQEFVTQSQKESLDVVQELFDVYGSFASADDKRKASAIALKYAEEQSKKHIEGAVKAAEFLGVRFSVALEWMRQIRTDTTALEEIIRNIFNQTMDMAAANKEVNDATAKQVEASGQMLIDAQDLFDIRSGQKLTELELNKVLAARRPLEKAVEDAQEAYNEAFKTGVSAREAEALMDAQRDLAKNDRLRAAAQASMLVDKQILDSYSNASKAQIKIDLDRVDAMVKMFKVLYTIMPDAGTGPDSDGQKRIAAMENLQADLQKIYDKAGSGKGGGGGNKNSKGDLASLIGFGGSDNSAEWDEWAKQELDDALDAINKAKKSLNIGGRVDGGFFNESSFFGSTSPEDMKAAEEALTKLNALQSDAVRKFGFAHISEIMGDSEGVDLFNRRLEEMERHIQRLADISKNVSQFATALHSMHDGMDDLFGPDVVTQFGDFASGLDTFSTALRANKDAYTLVNSAMPTMRAFTKFLTKDRQAQAAVEAIMQGAAAWAAYAEGNYVGGTMHAMSATMYASLAAGKGLRLPKGKNKEDKPKNDSAKYSMAKMRDVHIHIEGLPTTEVERGQYLREAIRAADRAGA